MKTHTISAAQSGTFRIGGDLPVHRLGFGAMRITGDGIWGPPKDRQEALRVLRRGIELGVNLIDTAEAYGPYVSEELIAEALYPYPKDLVIATKGGFDRPGADQWTQNGHPERLRQALDGSLRRLRLERIDLYQLHRIDRSSTTANSKTSASSRGFRWAPGSSPKVAARRRAWRNSSALRLPKSLSCGCCGGHR